MMSIGMDREAEQQLVLPIVQGISFIETVIDPGNWYVTALKNGKQVEAIHKTISKNGETMRQTIKGADPIGKPYDGLLLYDKQ